MKGKPLDDDDIIDILQPGDDEKQNRQEKSLREKFWPTMKRALAHLPFAEDIVTAYFVVLDKDTPRHVRGVILAALAYFIMPLDFIPDFLVGVGFTDDIAVLTTIIGLIRSHTTPDQKHAAQKALEEFKNTLEDK